MSEKSMKMICGKCGNVEELPEGYLTEYGQSHFICSKCRVKEAMPLESKVADKSRAGRKLLVEG